MGVKVSFPGQEWIKIYPRTQRCKMRKRESKGITHRTWPPVGLNSHRQMTSAVTCTGAEDSDIVDGFDAGKVFSESPTIMMAASIAAPPKRTPRGKYDHHTHRRWRTHGSQLATNVVDLKSVVNRCSILQTRKIFQTRPGGAGDVNHLESVGWSPYSVSTCFC